MKIKTFGFTTTRRFAAIAILASFILSNAFAFDALRGKTVNVPAVSATTAKYTTDLTKLAREGRLSEDLSVEAETSRLIKVLSEGGVRQPVVVDKDSAVQELIVEQAVIRIAKGQAGAKLNGRTILKIETDVLFSNNRTKADIASAVDSIVADVVATKGQTILYVNELTNLVGKDAVNTKLFSAIAEGRLVMIGGSGAIAYDEQIQSQPEIAAYFAGILVAGKSNAQAVAEKQSKPDQIGFRGDNVSPDLRAMMAEDPSGNKRVDVILQAKDAENQSLRAIMAANKVRLTDRIGETDTLVVSVPLSVVNELSQSGLINYMSPDRELKSLGHIETTTGTSLMRSQPSGYGRSSSYTLDGNNVGIAVIDSGIYTAQKSFNDGTSSTRVVYSKNFVSGTTSTEDSYGHGTHVASVAAGSATRSSSAYKGVAPKTDIINLKVLNSLGFGSTSSLLDALNWVEDNYETYNIRVVNLSLGTAAIDS